jgi:hypothetical protein
MTSLKLYFVIISEDNPPQINVHRDLLTLQTAWLQVNRVNSVGLIHIGFIRPRIKAPASLLKFKGQVLVSVAAKWALPAEYISSVSVVAEMNLAAQIVPLYRLIKGLGFDQDESETSFKTSTITAGQQGNEIAAAALVILNDAVVPLNKEEIFTRIIESGLYEFSDKKPVSVLAIELNRHVINTDSPIPADTPLFAKIGVDRFSSLANSSAELTGWVKQLSLVDPDFVSSVSSYGIHSEESYMTQVMNLPGQLRHQLELKRFKALLLEIEIADPIQIIKIMPSSLIKSNISSLNFPVRILNVFGVNNINSLDDLLNLSVEDMLKWLNFGRRSVRDLCKSLLESVERLTEKYELVGSVTLSENISLVDSCIGKVTTDAYQIELASLLPLKAHFEKSLSELNDKQRQVIECRTGSTGIVMTLEAVGESLGVVRERVRQIQKQCVTKIIKTNFWSVCITLNIGQLLIDRSAPLYIEMLEIEDPWFEGFMGNYKHLAEIIEVFSENEIRIININGALVVSRIKLDVWVESVNHFRKSLNEKAKKGTWSRHDINATFKSALSDKGAPELVTLMWNEFEEALQFENESGEAKLLSFGVSAESVVKAVLLQAESPLHYKEVSVRASKLLGKPVDDRRALNVLMNQDAKLYGRGIYGLEKFNPISPQMCDNIRLVVENMMYEGQLMKQWHSSEILTMLQAKFSALPKELNNHILNIILQGSDRLTYIKRMVWARSDSKQSVNNRVDMADAFTQILEENGGPLKGKEIKDKLTAIRGVSTKLQLQPTDRMIQIGPDFWGLIERDIDGDHAENTRKLDVLYQKLCERKKGIHVSEVQRYVTVSDESDDLPSAYALLNLAQRDDRLHLGHSMVLGLTEWDGETRRLNISQAVRKLLGSMDEPMTTAEINARMEDLTEMPLSKSVTGKLLAEGAIYNHELKVWSKG